MPRAPKMCAQPGCTTPTHGGRCDEHRTGHNWTRYPSANNRTLTRQERAWFRDQVLRLHPVCPCGRPAVEADHITPIGEGGANDPRANGQGLCADCHRTKTLADRAARRRGGGEPPAPGPVPLVEVLQNLTSPGLGTSRT